MNTSCRYSLLHPLTPWNSSRFRLQPSVKMGHLKPTNYTLSIIQVIELMCGRFVSVQTMKCWLQYQMVIDFLCWRLRELIYRRHIENLEHEKNSMYPLAGMRICNLLLLAAGWSPGTPKTFNRNHPKQNSLACRWDQNGRATSLWSNFSFAIADNSGAFRHNMVNACSTWRKNSRYWWSR